jgi:hypothetical protein
VRFSIVIVGGAALALAACGGSGSTTRNSSGTASSVAAGGGVQGGVSGQITQLGGGSLVVKEPGGNVSVAYSTSTNVLQTSGATQSNITAGACVVVTGRRSTASDPVTAATVQVQYNMNGNCTPPPGVVLGNSAPGPAVSLRGKITSVSGGSFVMAPVTTGGALVTVDVPSTAGITRLDNATTSKLAVGQCVRVNGTQDAAGVVQARALIISSAGPAGCTGASGGQPKPSRSAAPGA